MSFQNLTVSQNINKFGGASRILDDVNGTIFVPVGVVTKGEKENLVPLFKDRSENDDFEVTELELENGAKLQFTTSKGGGGHSYILEVTFTNEKGEIESDKRWVAYGSDVSKLNKKYLTTDYIFESTELENELSEIMQCDSNMEIRFMKFHIVRKGNSTKMTPLKVGSEIPTSKVSTFLETPEEKEGITADA